LPLSWKLCVLNWDSCHFRFKVSEKKTFPPSETGRMKADWYSLVPVDVV
jgi:hypothetical protein